MAFVSCDDGNGVEVLTGVHWDTWVDDEADTTVTVEKQADGSARVTVGGTPTENAWDRWQAVATYFDYDRKLDPNKSYLYTLELWTESGTRTVSINYYEDLENIGEEIYLPFGQRLNITTEPKTFGLVNLQTLPKAQSPIKLVFQCGDTLGTFFIKVVSIEERTEEFSGSWVYQRYYDELEELQINNGKWERTYSSQDWQTGELTIEEGHKGTYTTSGNKITLVVTHYFDGGEFGDPGWYTKNELETTLKALKDERGITDADIAEALVYMFGTTTPSYSVTQSSLYEDLTLTYDGGYTVTYRQW
jgi:hypothetical protein